MQYKNKRQNVQCSTFKIIDKDNKLVKNISEQLFKYKYTQI